MGQSAGYSVSPASGDNPSDAVLPGPRVAVTLWQDGRHRVVEGFEGEALMVALKRAGLPLLAVCGGKGACGTCKVAFPHSWAWQLPAPEKRELRLLAHVGALDGERLSCRITLTAALNGLDVDACN